MSLGWISVVVRDANSRLVSASTGTSLHVKVRHNPLTQRQFLPDEGTRDSVINEFQSKLNDGRRDKKPREVTASVPLYDKRERLNVQSI